MPDLKHNSSANFVPPIPNYFQVPMRKSFLPPIVKYTVNICIVTIHQDQSCLPTIISNNRLKKDHQQLD